MTGFRLLALATAVALAGCAARAPVCPPAAVAKPEAPVLAAVAWDRLEGWDEADPRPGFRAFLASCQPLAKQPDWQGVCREAAALGAAAEADAIRDYYRRRFVPHRLLNADGSDQGLVTGYFEPILNGRAAPDARYRYPVYAPPSDMITVDLAALYPELKGLRLRGRLEGKRLVPYHARRDIEAGQARGLAGRELLWVDDALGLFFLQVQGSGRIRMADGSLRRIGYADQNGHPYRAVGKKLIELGELEPEAVSMQSILAWAKANPERAPDLLDYNPSYVFFRELPPSAGGPLGSQGVPLSDGHSLAVDVKHVPLGAPVFLATSWPDGGAAVHRLAVAQDTGGAIRGRVRADLFVGTGAAAGELAGRMKQPGRLWVLLPKPGR